MVILPESYRFGYISMNYPSKEIHEVLSVFATKIALKFKAIRTVEGQREAQIVAPIEELLKASQSLAKGTISVTNESTMAEVRGRPDLAVATSGLLQGFVELKAPGKGAQPLKFTNPRDRGQWAKFKKLPNIMYTDGTEWALFQEGSELPVACVTLGVDITTEGEKAITPDNAKAFATLLSRFFHWDPIVPKDPKDLAVGLAKLCHYLREDVEHAVSVPDSNLSEVMREWRARLFPDADDKRFADAYAQTVAYALLLAHSRGLDVPDIGKAVSALEPAHGLLGQALNVLTQPSALAEVKPAVDILFRYILAVNLSVFTKVPGEPWLYFYEDFLAEYDPALRKDFGVYYTPAEVVEAQTSLVSTLLRDKFNRKLGFGDNGVAVLDPGVGTATYLLGVIEHGVKNALSYGGPGYVPERASVMANNIYGFEYLVGPYAVAHLRISEEFKRHNATLPTDGIHIYLTDTLESPHATPPTLPGLFGKKLSDEHKKALKIKSMTPILVCLGNPPYDRHSAIDAVERGGWIRYGDGQDGINGLLHDYIEPVQEAGRGGDLKNLYNSYVYFWRWALWKVFEQGERPGIVSFITASSYLRGPAFLGMREHMRRTFDELWIIDLGGDNLGPRKTPNVFAIQTPVTIAVGARYGNPKPETPAIVHYTSLVEGSRDEKLALLAGIKDFTDLSWELAMTDWKDPFLPNRSGKFWDWPLVTDLFPWQHSGVQMKRTWVIAPDQNSLAKRWQEFSSATLKQKRSLFKETRDRKITSILKDNTGKYLASLDSITANAPIPTPVRYGFRSLDRQWVLVDTRLGDYLRPVLWQSYGPRQIYFTSLLSTVLGTGPAATVTSNMPDIHHFSGRGGKDIIPLWRDCAANHPNVTAGLLEALSSPLGRKVSPEDLFAYCYAILSAPIYADKFSEDLAIPGPRVPITKNVELFTPAVKLGRRLVSLHTYGERFNPCAIPKGDARIVKAIAPSPIPDKYTYDESKLYIGSGIVQPVTKEVWEFSVSGYKVLPRWLNYRIEGGAGKQTSDLDSIRSTSWLPEWTTELLELIWVLEATIKLLPEANRLLEQIITSPCFNTKELPIPTQEERQPPTVTTTHKIQGSLFNDQVSSL